MLDLYIFNRVTMWLAYGNAIKINCNVCGSNKNSGKSFDIDKNIKDSNNLTGNEALLFFCSYEPSYYICDVCDDTINFMRGKYYQECIKKLFLVKQIMKHYVNLDLYTLSSLYIYIYNMAFIKTKANFIEF